MFAVFVAWAAFSFLAHRLAKSYFQAITYNNEKIDSRSTVVLLMSAVLVTGVQLLVCGILSLFQTSKSTNPNLSTKWLSAVTVLHAFGVLATNYSMALIPASSTHLVKVMEPMITAVITWLVVGIVLPKQKMLGILLVVIGSIGATCNLFDASSINAHGVQLALSSNFLYGSRNVIIKHLLGHNVVFDIFIVGKVSLLGAVILMIPCILLCAYNFGFVSLIFPNTTILFFIVGSAVCHATYTYISTCVILNRLSVIGHSLANVSKRVAVISLLYVFSQKGYLSPFFLIVCCLGLVIYTRSAMSSEPKVNTTENDNKSSSALVTILVVMTVLATMTCIGVTTTSTKMKPTNNSHPYWQTNINFKKIFFKRLQFWTEYKENSKVGNSRLVCQIDNPNQTDNTLKDILTAPEAIAEASKIQIEIYKDLIGHYRKAVLVGINDHLNFGDSAITVGEFMALNKLGIELIYYCSRFTCGDFKAAKQAIKKTSEPVIILSSGGGNFGNWKPERNLREKLVRTFKNHEILVLPQSVDFQSKEEMKKNAEAMNVHANITYLFRDHKSYDIIVNSGLYKYKRAVLCPDAAVQIGIQTFSFEPTHDILWLKREDKESFYKNLPTFPNNISVLVSDWAPPENQTVKFPNLSLLEKSYARLLYGFRFLSRGKVVVTDRLHGHILSVLLNKPHVLLDNSYRKLSTYHAAWTPSLTNVVSATNVTEAIKMAQYLMQKHYA